MKKTLFLISCVLLCASLAAAQTKVSGTGKCGKPDTQQSIDVGDRAKHTLVIAKQTCTWTSPLEMAGLKSKDYVVSASSDSTGARSQDRGYVVVTMENGDKAFVRFTGAAMMKDGAPESSEGTWTFAGGTGKLKGLKGKGTYKNTPASGDQIEGEYALPTK